MPYITFIAIVVLIFVNGFTDAPNAITTVVSTKVLPFKKAARLSAIFNLIGIFIMCIISFKVANGISSIVTLTGGKIGLIAVFSSMVSCIIFSVIASICGIPTSETHGLIAGLTGSAIVIGNIHQVNIIEWLNVILGLFWSILGCLIVIKIVSVFKNRLYKMDLSKIRVYQKWSSYGLSFMHGAQDGQKFIGIVILYLSIIKGSYQISTSAKDNLWIIVFVAVIMFLGVSVGGRRIVENIGNNTVELDNVKGIISDIGTIITLFLASLLGFPVSTTHVKTMSIIALEKNKANRKNISNIFQAWIWTFPICFGLSYLISKILIENIKLI